MDVYVARASRDPLYPIPQFVPEVGAGDAVKGVPGFSGAKTPLEIDVVDEPWLVHQPDRVEGLGADQTTGGDEEGRGHEGALLIGDPCPARPPALLPEEQHGITVSLVHRDRTNRGDWEPCRLGARESRQ